ncbi:MAG: ISNCY family transposase [Candidatus Thermoplasmatota archaeon]|nr:ISNCY family transposase [Candidatus Thermoplasmatota archaeon]
MNLTTKNVREAVEILDDIIEEYNDETPKKKRDWRTYEQQLAQRIKTAVKDLEPLIIEAISTIKFTKGDTRGRKQKLTLKQKVELLLIKHLIEKSNREMSNMLVIFSLLSDIDVSYKSVERLYSDEGVHLVLINLHVLILKKKGVNDPDCSGDGTGYALTIKKHYASVAQKLKDKAKKNSGQKITKRSKKRSGKKTQFIYSFKMMDLDTRLYVGSGSSLKSEKEAYIKAVKMSEIVDMDSIRLDRYYSTQKDTKLLEDHFGKDIKIYVIPKKNATVKGSWKWKELLENFVTDTKGYLSEYYRRNQSESAFSEDKRRFGWRIAQRRPDRIDTHDFCTTLWHNMLWMGRN